MARTTPDLVRKALGADESEYADSDLDFPIDIANELIDQEVAPHADATTDLKTTETFVAAAEAVDDGPGADAPVTSVSQGSAQISYDTSSLSDEATTYWEKALRYDPTGQLAQADQPKASLFVPDTIS
jgi:hypothetical protein